MTELHRRTALALLLPGMAALAGCGTTTAQPTTSSGDMNPSDLDFVTSAQNIIAFDQQVCRLAEVQAKSPQVRALAQKLLDDANMFDARLQPVVMEAGIKPPTQLRSDLRVRLAHMRLQNGLDFDRTFLDDQIATHEEIINRQQMMPEGSNPKIVALAKAGAGIMSRNLAELRRVRASM